MKTKIVFQTDILGFFMGETLADESPLEPGVFHIPAGCVESSPPALNDGERARWSDGSWIIEKLTSEELDRCLSEKELSTMESVESARALSYADPLNGSDRLFSESYRMQIMGEDGADEIKSKAVARYKEIQAQYPWPTK